MFDNCTINTATSHAYYRKMCFLYGQKILLDILFPFGRAYGRRFLRLDLKYLSMYIDGYLG